MQLLKILILAVFAASIANINVCSNVPLQKNNSDSGNKQFIISSAANASSVPLYLRQNQQGKKTVDCNGLHKICSSLSCKKRFTYFGSRELFFAISGKISEYSLISLHCLITI